MARYDKTEWFLVEKEGVTRAFHERTAPMSSNDFNLNRSSVFHLAENDLLDRLAWIELQDSRQWSVIAEINLPNTYDPLAIEENTLIIVPSADQVV